ncbi:MAG: M3 family oligoendopeptidase [Candidatus Dojkabacteria bacterium]|nr:M3 family oligoendopeptidase [Candidatus Dojkabacteria bacterium]
MKNIDKTTMDKNKRGTKSERDGRMWNFQLMYSGPTDPQIQKDVEQAARKVEAFAQKWKARSDYLTDPGVLKTALDEYEDLLANYGTSGNAGYYWALRQEQNKSDPAVKAQVNKLHEKEVKLENEIEFFLLNIGKVPPKTQRIMLGSKKLEPYHHLLYQIFATSRYDLTEPEERIMNVKSKTSHSNWVQMTSRFIAREEGVVLDIDGKERKKTFSEALELLDEPDKKVRDSSAQLIHHVTEKYADVAESELNSILENKKAEDTLRGYGCPDLPRHLSDDIESAVVDAMLETVEADFSVPQRYYRLKAALLGQPSLAYHERNVRYGVLDKKYTYEEAVKMVTSTFADIDPEFSAILESFVTNGQIDVFPRKNKSGGAFCAHGLKISPVYILLNFTGSAQDVLTIAHESGHGINNEMMRKSQNSLNFSSPLSTAEVASTFFEDFVLEKLLCDADDEMRLAIMMMKMNDEVSTIFRQVACYRFEQALHSSFAQKGYLSRADIGTVFTEHMSAYMGEAVTQDPGSENWWVYWGHIRRFFYVYSYASGLLISKSLQSMVRQDPRSVKSIKTFLSAGSSKSPLDIFRECGIDIADKGFWKKGVEETERLLDDIETLAKSLGMV